MPLALLIAGGFLAILAINGKYDQALTLAGNLVKSPSGAVTLLEAGAGLVLVAAIFRFLDLERAGEAFITLLLVVFLISNGQSFLTEFEKAFAASGGSTPASGGSSATPASGGLGVTPASGGSSVTLGG